MNIFERASRASLNYPSPVGDLTTDMLWTLPLTAKAGRPSLDVVARLIYSELKDLDEVSFVDTTPNPRKTDLELMLEIVKHVIESKKADMANVARRAENAARRQRLVDALGAKEAEELTGKPKEDIQRELAELDAG